MIVRLAALCLAGAGAYALLRGMPPAIPPLVRSCLAVLLLFGGLAWWAIGRRAEDFRIASGSTKPKLRDYLAIGMGVLALECGFLWVLSAAPRPLERFAAVIEMKLRPQAAVDRAAAAAGGRQASGNWLWQDEGRRVLPRRTDLKPGAKPEVFLRLLREEDARKLLERKTYVRAFALDDYRNGVWSSENPRNQSMEADATGWIRFGELIEGEILHEIFHGKDAGGRDVVTALQGLRAVRLPEIRVTSDGMALLPGTGGADGFGYMAGSFPLALEDLEGLEVDWKASAPAPGGGRLSALAAKAAGNGDVLRKLLNIQDFLRRGYRYSLVTENPKDLDPLENFLFDEKRGHCEFFATAGALLARELGVETRVAYGWAGGEYFKDGLMFVFRAREAHSWVEVKVPGRGWAVMEPTPPVFLGGGGMPKNAGAGEQPPSRAEIAEPAVDDASSAGTEHVSKVAMGMTLAFGIIAVIAFIAKAMRRPAESCGFASLPLPELKAGYFRSWAKSCEERGLRWPSGTTLKSRLDDLDDRPGFAKELLSYHYGVKYEGKSPDPQCEAKLTERIKRWE